MYIPVKIVKIGVLLPNIQYIFFLYRFLYKGVLIGFNN